MNAQELAQQVQETVVSFRRDLHRHPEASFQEVRTTQKIAQALDAIGISYRRFEPTGLIGEIKGYQPGKTVALRADIDALSITEKSDVDFKSENEGFMHACGHDTHTAMLLGAAKALYSCKDEWSGTVKVIFQPAEEIGKGASALIDQGALEGVDMIFGMHIFPQAPVGLIAVQEGAAMAATDAFKIKINGNACHGAMPETGVDATVAASALVLNLQSIVSREISPMESVVVSVGSLHSGSRFNIISGYAELEGTVRSFNRDVHQQLPQIIERIVQNTAATYRCTAELEYDMITDVLITDDQATRYVYQAAKAVAQRPELVITAPKTTGGEDFASYTSQAPAGFVFLGAGGSYPLHSDYFSIDEEAFQTGVAFHIQVALDFLADA